MADELVSLVDYPSWNTPQEGIARYKCETCCPLLLDVEKKFTDGLNRGDFDRAEYNIVNRTLWTEAVNDLNEARSRAGKCLGAVMIDGEIKCGYRVPSCGSISVKLPFEGSK